MKIAVGPLAEGVTQLESVLAGEELGLEGREARAGARLHLRVKLTKMGEEVMVAAEITGEIQAECSRCLEPFSTPFQEAFTVLFAPASQSTGALRGRGAFSKEDQRLRFYREGEIDLTEDIRATVGLAIPLRWICRPDCRGLCRRCGQNLNQGPCSCPREEGGGYYPFRGLRLK